MFNTLSDRVVGESLNIHLLCKIDFFGILDPIQVVLVAATDNSSEHPPDFCNEQVIQVR